MKAACRRFPLSFSPHGRVQAPLLLLTGLLVCCICFHCAAAISRADKYSIKQAESLFSHWSRIAHAMPRGGTMRDAMKKNDSELLQLAVDDGKLKRADLFRWHAANRSFTVNTKFPGEWQPQYPTWMLQSQLYRHFLELVFSNPEYSSKLTHDCAFFFEADDGFQARAESQKLPLPLLCNARTPTSVLADPYSLPAPDLFMAFGLHYWKLMEGKAPPTTFWFPKWWAENHPHQWKTFALNHTLTAWEDKIDDVIMRAWGIESMNPFEYMGPRDLAVGRGTRRDVCHVAEEHNLSSSICCSLVPGHECPNLALEEMMKYRYQLNIDGLTNSWDASLWKYQSGSVVLYVHPTNNLTGHWLKPWDLWWTPLMVPYKHYIPTDVGNLLATLAAVKGLPDGGKSFADAARMEVRRSVNFESAAHYAYLLVKHVHDAAEAL